MNFHFNTPTTEVLAWLRDKAIAGRMPEQFIAALDNMDTTDLQAENAEMSEKLEQAEKDRDNLLGELEDLVRALQNDGLVEYPKAIENAIKIAESAIERHST
jgi:hypothetical protein